MARRKKRNTSLQDKISAQLDLGAFFEPVDVDMKKISNPFSYPTKKIQIPEVNIPSTNTIFFSNRRPIKIPSAGNIDIPTGITGSGIKSKVYGEKKRQGKGLTAKQLGISKEQLDIIKQANNRLRKLEENAFARASPAAEAVINRLSQIYGDNKPNEVSFYLDNDMDKAKKAQVISEARKFIKMSTSTVEGTQEAINNRDRELANTWDFLVKNSDGSYMIDEEGNYVIDNERLSDYQDIAELYSSDIKTYSLGSKDTYEVISNAVNRGVDIDIVKVALEIALDSSDYEDIEKGEITSRLNSEIDFVSKAFDFLDSSDDLQKEHYDELEKDYFRFSIAELKYENLDDALEQIDYFRSHLNERREAVDKKKRGNFKFKW